ncbi:FHA domain-containing protein FhaB/FipA [Dietzia alimentaria]|uniref:FHA domain-containing protein FhaB/FipA n=1 Tax=Dietzia alimentaria TaxID=665550 RepID=UPI00029A5660|nr:FHA domain-containing protein [Dietzia alimentaria]
MQGLVLQLSRGLLLALLWLFIYLTLRALKTDVFGNVGMRAGNRTERKTGLFGRGSGAIRYLVVTQGALSGTRITLSEQPVLLGRADSCTLVIDDDYASNQHARLSPHGPDWFLEDLGSTNGTYLDRTRVTTPVKVDAGTPIRIGKTVIELRA